jgi:hypothetical protein
MSTLDEDLNRATVKLCRDADRALLDYILRSGVIPQGIDIDLLTARVALWDVENAINSRSFVAWAVAVVAVLITAWATWRRKWTDCLTTGRYRRAASTTWLTVRAVCAAFRLAWRSERHIIFEIESMIKLVSA